MPGFLTGAAGLEIALDQIRLRRVRLSPLIRSDEVRLSLRATWRIRRSASKRRQIERDSTSGLLRLIHGVIRFTH
jgi:hypothetical protein